MNSPVSDIGDRLFVTAFDEAREAVVALVGKADRQHEQIARGTAHGALAAAIQYAAFRGDVDIADVLREAMAQVEAMRSAERS
jgi:hypothetical protein